MKTVHPNSRKLQPGAVALAAAMTLAACGGGSDGDRAAPAPAPAAPALTLSGTAATGAAIAGGAVDAKCAAGSGSATSAADGTFQVAVAAGSLPCLLRVTAADGTELHSLAVGSGSAATANITPLSELIVAYLLGEAPADAFAGFGAGSVAALDPAAVEQAIAAVADVLKKAGVDLSGVDNPLTAQLVAARDGVEGNAFDQALDRLRAALAESGTSLATVVQAVRGTSPAAPAGAVAGAPALPPEMLLRKASAGCASLRSGRYRFVIVNDSDHRGETEQIYDDYTGVAVFDAGDDSFTAEGTGDVARLTAAGKCRYTTDRGADVAVSPAGVIVERGREGGVMRMSIGFPEQAIKVGDLAGEWSMIGAKGSFIVTGPDQYEYRATHIWGRMRVASDGSVAPIEACDDERCLTATGDLEADDWLGDKLYAHANEAIVPQRDGCHMIQEPEDAGGSSDNKLCIYRAGNGAAMMVHIDPFGYLHLWTRSRPAARPAVGRVSEFWNVSLNPRLEALLPVSRTSNTVTSLAADGMSFVRNAVIDFATGVTRPETIQLDSPRDGYLTRVAGPATASDGTLSNVSEWIALPMTGMGITGVAITAPTATTRFVVSVDKLPD